MMPKSSLRLFCTGVPASSHLQGENSTVEIAIMSNNQSPTSKAGVVLKRGRAFAWGYQT